MGKPDVFLKFDAQTATFVQEILKAKAALESVSDTTRKLGDDAETNLAKYVEKMKNAKKETVDGAEKLKDYATSFIGIGSAATAAGTAVKLAFNFIDTQLEKAEAKAGNLKARVEALNGALAASGQGAESPLVRKQLHDLATEITRTTGRVTTDDDTTQALHAIKEPLGGRLAAADSVGATRAAMLARAIGMESKDANQVGINFGQLARFRAPGEGLGGMSDEQLQDLAFKIQVNKPGGLSDRDMRFFARSKDKNFALKLVLAASQSDENTRGLASLQNAAEADPLDGLDKKALRKLQHTKFENLSPEEQRKLTLSRIASGEDARFQAMLANPDLAPSSERPAIRNLAKGMGRVAETRSMLDELAAVRGSEDAETRAARGLANVEAINARIKQSGEVDAANFQARRELAEAYFKKKFPIASKFPGFGSFLTNYLPAGVAAASGATFEGGAPAAPSDSRAGQGIIDAINSLHLSVKAQSAVQRTRRDTTLSNDSEGQK